LAALSLNLEGARHLAAGGVREKLDTCRDVAQSLLKELREVVGRPRDEPAVDDPGVAPDD
jgi:signal transduction histidine kinase